RNSSPLFQQTAGRLFASTSIELEAQAPPIRIRPRGDRKSLGPAAWRSRRGNSKVHGNASFGWNNLSRLVMRFEAPLFDCLQRGEGHNVRTTDHSQSLNDSILIHPRSDRIAIGPGI